MELVGKLRYLNEYGELETVKPGDREEALAVTEVVALGTWVVLIVPVLSTFYMFTGKNGLVCCFVLMVVYGHKGQWCRQRWWKWGKAQ